VIPITPSPNLFAGDNIRDYTVCDICLLCRAWSSVTLSILCTFSLQWTKEIRLYGRDLGLQTWWSNAISTVESRNFRGSWANTGLYCMYLWL